MTGIVGSNARRGRSPSSSRRLEWWEVDAPELQDEGDALVEPVAVATCDLDTAI
jgi:hypothetical protein